MQRHIQRPPHLCSVCPGSPKTPHETRLNFKNFVFPTLRATWRGKRESEEGTYGGWGATVRARQCLWVAEEKAAQRLQDLSSRTGVRWVCTPWGLQLQSPHASEASISGILLWCFWEHEFPTPQAQLCTVLTQDQKLHHHFVQPKESSPVWTFSKTLTASHWHIGYLKTIPSFFLLGIKSSITFLETSHHYLVCLPSSMAFSLFLHWGGGK